MSEKLSTNSTASEQDWSGLVRQMRLWASELGFQQLGITDTDLSAHEGHLQNWLDSNQHGDMDYMQKHGSRRSRPDELLPGTVRVISVRMDYLPESQQQAASHLQDPVSAYLARYALGRDYHKLMRKRLQKLSQRIQARLAELSGHDRNTGAYRVFVDSAPVLEKALAEKAGLGWIGKHSNLINDKAGSWFFLGEIYTNLPLPVDSPAENHCGTCEQCMVACPTDAIVAPYRVDARRCISYLTIELRSAIPVEFRAQIGNRIYGCDDCQLACPWNRFAHLTDETDFLPRHGLDHTSLLQLFAWDEQQFLQRMEGSAIRRIGYDCWVRNIAVALGNCDSQPEIVSALKAKRPHVSEMVVEHIDWAVHRLER